MTQFKLAVALLAIVGLTLVAEQAAQMPGPAPDSISPVAQTPQIIQDRVAAEKKQRQYADAEQAAMHVLISEGCGQQYAEAIGRAAVNNRIPSKVVAAVMFVESSCNPAAVSPAGAQGLMQINPRVWKHSYRDLRDPGQNIQIGAHILASYIHSRGLREGLHSYNGLGDPTNDYSDRVIQVAYARQCTDARQCMGVR